MKTYILDIETKPQANLVDLFNENLSAPKNIKDPEKIKLAIEKKKLESVKAMSVDTDYAEIFCIGVKELGKEPKILSLEEFALLLNRNQFIQLITFNGKKFDLPVIIKQGIKQKIDLPYKSLKIATERFKSGAIDHIDLMEVLGEYGKYRSLDTYLQIYLGIAKKEINFATCTDEELKEHCLEDISNCELLYNKFKELI